MAKDHYLPAAFIGRFSAHKALRARNREVYVYNTIARKHLRLSPGAIGAKQGLYNLSGGKTIDKWQYEASLNRVLDLITEAKPIRLDDWVRVAVPFVAGLFVRGKEFDKRYESMPVIETLMKEGNLNPDNTNVSRIIRLQRQLSPLTAARWVVLHNTGATPLVSNDLGIMLTRNLLSGEDGWAIPLDTKTVLGIFFRRARSIATYQNGDWFAHIEHLYPMPWTFLDFNRQMAITAQEFLFGPTAESIHSLAAYVDIPGPSTPLIMEMLWSKEFRRADLLAHEFAWAKIASIANLNLSPAEASKHNYAITDMMAKNKWVPPILSLPGEPIPGAGRIEFHNDNMHLHLPRIRDSQIHPQSS